MLTESGYAFNSSSWLRLTQCWNIIVFDFQVKNPKNIVFEVKAH